MTQWFLQRSKLPNTSSHCHVGVLDEIVSLSYPRLMESKEGASVRPIGLPVVEFLEARREKIKGNYVFPGIVSDAAFDSFPNHWEELFKKSKLSDVTPHVLRRSFASIANDLGYTEVTIAALMGDSKGSVTSKYIHAMDTVLVMAADNIAGCIQGLMDGLKFKHTAYSFDKETRKSSLSQFLISAQGVASKDEPPGVTV